MKTQSIFVTKATVSHDGLTLDCSDGELVYVRFADAALGAAIGAAVQTATHDWRDDNIVLGVGDTRFCWGCGCDELSAAATEACDHGRALSASRAGTGVQA